jgi:hypothetical protein
MRTLIVLGAIGLVNLVGAVAFLAAGKLALHLDPSANDSHLSSFITAITAVAVAVGSAFPIFARGVPWATSRLERAWPARPPEVPAHSAYEHQDQNNSTS